MELTDGILFYVVLLISLVVHEASHALFALIGGDRTAYVGGQVSLNPVPHIQREPFGTVVLPILMLILSQGRMCMGYATTPIDANWAHRFPKRAALMSAAGPLSNLAMAALAFLVLKTLIWTGQADAYPRSGIESFSLLIQPAEDSGSMFAICKIASVFVFLNVVLAIFNLLPWPPLDGAGVVSGLVPDPMERFYAFIRQNPMLMILGIVGVWQILPDLFLPVMGAILDWL